MAAFCREHAVTLAVMEATGGYERQTHTLLGAAGVPSAIVNPCQVRRLQQVTELCTIQKNQKRLVTDPLVLAQFDSLLHSTPSSR